jgi:hypothetical protein
MKTLKFTFLFFAVMSAPCLGFVLGVAIAYARNWK